MIRDMVTFSNGDGFNDYGESKREKEIDRLIRLDKEAEEALTKPLKEAS